MVAKSYQSLEIVEEAYTVNGKAYVKVRMKNGSLKQVRWYTDYEYTKMYPETKKVEKSAFTSQKEALGFQKGYIHVFKGDTYTNLEWFKQSNARYSRWWGWYIVSTEEVPAELPFGIETVKLHWETVGTADGSLKPDEQIKSEMDKILYDEGPSRFVGEKGERLELCLTVDRAISVFDGEGTMHIMHDDCENIFIWTTAAKNWEVGSEHHIRGTVKDHRIYRNNQQTILTRCMEVK